MASDSGSGFNLTASLFLQRVAIDPAALSRLQATLAKKQLTIPVTLKANGQQVNAMASALAKASSSANATSKAFRNVNHEAVSQRRYFTSLVRDVSSLTAGYVGLYQVSRLVRSGFKGWASFESQMGSLAQITNKTIPELASLGTAIDEASKKYGVSAERLLQASQELLQAGKSEETVKKLANVFALASKNSQVGEQGLQDLAKGFISWQNVFAASDSELVNALEKSIALSKLQYAEVSSLIQGSTILGKVWQNAGGSLDEMLATLAAVKTGTARPIEEVSRGLSTIVQRITSPETARLLEGNGVKLFDDDSGKFRGVIAVVKDIAALREKLDPATREGKELDRVLSGIRRQSIGATLLSNIDQIAENLKTAGEAGGELERDFEKTKTTISQQMSELGATFQSQFRNMLDNSPFGTLAKESVRFTTELLKMEAALTAVFALSAGAGLSRLGGGLSKFGSRLSLEKSVGGFRGAGAYALGATRPMQGIAGIGALYASSTIQPETTGGAAAKGGLEGLGVSLTALALGVSPLVAGFSGLVVGMQSFGKALETARDKALDLKLKEQVGQLSGYQQRAGLTDVRTIASFKDTVKTLVEAKQKARGVPSGFELSSRSGWFEDEPTAIARIMREDIAKVKEQATALQPQVEAFVNAFVEGGYSLAEWDTAMGGVMKSVSVLDSITNETDITLKELVAQRLQEVAIRKQGNNALAESFETAVSSGRLSYSLTQRSSALTLPTELTREPVEDYKGLQRIGTSDFDLDLKKLPLDKVEASILASINESYKAIGDTLATTTFDSGSFKTAILESLEGLNLAEDVHDEVLANLENISWDEFKNGLADIPSLLERLHGGLGKSVAAAQQFGDKLRAIAEANLNQIKTFQGQNEVARNARFAAIGADIGVRRQIDVFAGKPTRAGVDDRFVRAQAGGSTEQLSATLQALQQEFNKTKDARISVIIDQTKSRLALLADATARTADSMQRLNEVEQSRTSKLGVLEEFFGGDAQQRARIQSETQAATTAANKGTLQGLSIEQQQAAVSGLRRMSGVENAFVQGETGGQTLERILTEMGQGWLVPEDVQRDNLQSQVIATMQDAAKAQQELAKYEAQLQATFFSQLSAENKSFLQSMASIVGAEFKATPQAPIPMPQLPALGQGQQPKQLQANAVNPLIDPPAAKFPSFLEGANRPMPGLPFGQTPVVSRQEEMARRRAGFEADKLQKQVGFQASKDLRAGMTPEAVQKKYATQLQTLEDKRARAQGVQQAPNKLDAAADKLMNAADRIGNARVEREAGRAGEVPKENNRNLAGEAIGVNKLESVLTGFGVAVGDFGGHATSFNNGVNSFGSFVNDFQNAIGGFPTEISLQAQHTIAVTLPDNALAELEPKFREIAVQVVGNALDNFKVKLADNGPGMI